MTGLEILGAVVGLAGTVVQAAGASQQASAAAAAAKYNEQVATRNAAIARTQASNEQEDKRLQNRRQLAQIRASYGASGLDASGSVLDVILDTATEQDLDVAKIGYKGDLAALQYTDKAQQYDAEAKNAKAAGTFGVLSAVAGGASSLLKGATSSGSSMSRW